MSVAIMNMALDFLEEEPILTAEDDRTAVRWMNRNFGPIRDAMLRSHPWNFALKRAGLARLAAIPSSGWSYGYELPADCLRILPLTSSGYLNGSAVSYAVEGRTILSNSVTPAIISYVSRVESEADMDPLFVQALAVTVAARAASFITGKNSLAQTLSAQARELTMQAQMVDALEGSAPTPDGDDFFNARSGWGSY
jgi:hypothetical protein